MAELQEFSYRAVNPEGETVSGRLAAVDRRRAVVLLQGRGLIPLRVEAAALVSAASAGQAGSRSQAGAVKGRSRPSRRRQRVRVAGKTANSLDVRFKNWVEQLPGRRPGTKELAGFDEDLGLLLKAGVPLNRALVIIIELLEKPRFREVVQNLQDQVREGSTFWGALQSHPAVFPPVFIGMVRAGESSGILDATLERLALYLSGIQELKDFLLGAMIYPIILTLTTGVSIALLLALVLPKFAAIFADMGIALPLATKIMLECGNFLHAWWWLLLLLAGGLLLGIRRLYRHPQGRRLIDRLMLRLPGLGPLLIKIDLARFFRTLGAMLAGGLPILEALQIVVGVISNSRLREKVEHLREELRRGAVISRVLAADPLFPSLAVHMIGVGEETGNLDDMLEKLAEMYDRELKVTIKALTSLFEPLVILFMGLVIGAIVISMLMAIFSVNELGG